MAGQIVVARHGQTEWSANGRHTGVTDIPLTADGEEQARELGAGLQKWSFVSVYTSPRRRARHTAELAGLRAADGSDPVVLPDLVEWDYGEYEGRTTADINAERAAAGEPRWWKWTDGCPGGEAAEDVAARVDRVLSHARDDIGRGDVALVAHGHVLRVLIARWLGQPPQLGASFAYGTARVGLLGHEHGQPTLSLWNADPGDPALMRDDV